MVGSVSAYFSSPAYAHLLSQPHSHAEQGILLLGGTSLILAASLMLINRKK